MRIIKWKYPDGTVHDMLPKTWGNLSGITLENAYRLGFIRHTTYKKDPPPVITYSKLRLYDALVRAGIWDDVKSAIENAGQWERWELANELSTDYEPFAQLLSQLRQTYGDDTTDGILESAEM